MFWRFINTAITVADVCFSSYNASADVIVFNDGEFDDGDWSATVFGATYATGNTSQVSSGGNPGTYRQSTARTTEPSRNPPVTIFHFRDDFTYNPSVSGEIISYRGMFDIRRFDSSLWNFTMILRQNATIYQGGPIAGGSSTGWISVDTGSLTPVSFGVWNSPTGTDPDFSSAGSTIEFGYATLGFLRGVSESTAGFDNFQVTLNTNAASSAIVPEPSSFGLMAMGFCGAGMIYRRRIGTRAKIRCSLEHGLAVLHRQVASATQHLTP